MDHLQIMFWKFQNKYEIINTETADQNILDSDVSSLFPIEGTHFSYAISLKKQMELSLLPCMAGEPSWGQR
jgi:hypothetical protein